MWNFLKRWFNPARAFLPKEEVFRTHDKLCFALGRYGVDLFRVALKDEEVWFCLAKIKNPQRIWMDGTRRGQLQQLTFLNFYGPCDTGAFQLTTSTLPHAIVRTFLAFHLGKIPSHLFEIVDRIPMPVTQPFWKELNGCFGDALRWCKMYKGHQPVVSIADDGGHAASVLLLPDGSRISDYTRPYGKTTKLKKWDQIAQEVLPTTPVKTAYLIAL